VQGSESPSLVLLLTATIDPGATPMVARADPLVRLRDYHHALEVWLKSRAVSNIVFCENSGYDLNTLRLLTRSYRGQNVEFISYRDSEDGAKKGKGFAELGCIARAIKESALLSTCDVLIKGTGRLTVRNAAELVPIISTSRFDVMCTLKKNLTFADSRFFAAKVDFYSKYLLSEVEIVDDNEGVFAEHALACAVARAVADRRVWQPFPIFPHIEGISGTFGTTLTSGFVKRRIKSVYHRIRNFVYKN
jgi:hypothetical protein